MRLTSFIIFALSGLALLLGLGIWQVQRLDWKREILAQIEARIDDAPVALPDQIDSEADKYLAVTASGQIVGEALHVLISTAELGPSYRVIAPFQTAGQVIMADLGALPVSEKSAALPDDPLTLTGNLHWPDEIDSFTPEPDRDQNIWFARDVPQMAAALGAEPILVVVRQTNPPFVNITPLPVGIDGIPNDHLQYAITWFSLAAIWLGMTAALVWRMASRHG